MRAHYIYRDEDTPQDAPICSIHVASREAAARVIAAGEGDDGRTAPVWVRLSDGTLILGVLPTGDMFEVMQQGDAIFPGEGESKRLTPKR